MVDFTKLGIQFNELSKICQSLLVVAVPSDITGLP